MANPKWRYPTVAAATSTLEFTYGDFMSDGESVIGNVLTDETQSGEIMQTSLGDDKTEHTFTCLVPTTDPASGDLVYVGSLKTFISTTIGWAARTFYYTDSFGVSYAVKLLSTSVTPSKRHVNYNRYTFKFREV